MWLRTRALALALGILIVGCGVNCSPYNLPDPGISVVAPPPRPHATVVLITIACPDGTAFASGAALNDQVVLTARHATFCDDTEKVEPLAWAGIVHGSMEHPVLLREIMRGRDKTEDAALLVAYPGTFDTPGTVVGLPPQRGDKLCWMHAWPSLGETCAKYLGREANGAMHLDQAVEPGGSGSALYDEGGKIVGVTVAYHQDAYTGQGTDGYAVDLTGRLAWMATP